MDDYQCPLLHKGTGFNSSMTSEASRGEGKKTSICPPHPFACGTVRHRTGKMPRIHGHWGPCCVCCGLMPRRRWVWILLVLLFMDIGVIQAKTARLSDSSLPSKSGPGDPHLPSISRISNSTLLSTPRHSPHGHPSRYSISGHPIPSPKVSDHGHPFRSNISGRAHYTPEMPNRSHTARARSSHLNHPFTSKVSARTHPFIPLSSGDGQASNTKYPNGNHQSKPRLSSDRLSSNSKHLNHTQPFRLKRSDYSQPSDSKLVPRNHHSTSILSHGNHLSSPTLSNRTQHTEAKPPDRNHVSRLNYPDPIHLSRPKYPDQSHPSRTQPTEDPSTAKFSNRTRVSRPKIPEQSYPTIPKITDQSNPSRTKIPNPINPSRPKVSERSHHPRPRSPGVQSEDDPLSRLSRVFGIRRIPVSMVHHTPPQYMTDLYKTVADTTGLTRSSGPYNANTVRSFPDRDTVHQEHYFYNVSHLAADQGREERILQAEFHLFRLKPRPSRHGEPFPPHHLQLKVYQVLQIEKMNTPQGLRLLDARRISTHAHGWLTFNVSKAIHDWISRPDSNHGLLVVAQSSQGQAFSNSSFLRFAQRHQHHDSKQPILVVFTRDHSTARPTFVSPDDQDYQQLRKEMERTQQKKTNEKNERQRKKAQRKQDKQSSVSTAGFSRSTRLRQAIFQLNEQARFRNSNHSASSLPHGETRIKRSVGGDERTLRSRGAKRKSRLNPRRQRKRRIRKAAGGGQKGNKRKRQGRRKRMFDRFRRSCSRHKMYVDFDEIGWSGWIISPKGYDAYHCVGECPFPLGQSQKPTNHATVQSIVHALGVGGKYLGTPCCVPNKLFSISLLYFDDDENVILKQYDDMVAASCGCH